MFHAYGCTVLHVGANTDVMNQIEQTPLHLAAREGNGELVRFLLDKLANPNLTDQDGNIPLDLAAKREHEAVIDLLLEHSTSSKTEDDMKNMFRKAQQPKTIDDDYVKAAIRAMSPPRYEFELYSDCISFTLMSPPPSWLLQCG